MKRFFASSDPRGVHADTGASARGADRQLPSAQREDAGGLLQVHPEGPGGHGLEGTGPVEFHQLCGYEHSKRFVCQAAASFKPF